MARDRAALATLLLILLLAFALRLYRLGQADIWWDEGFSVWLARFEPASIAQMTVVDEHPPLHYWFLSLWNRLAGETEVAVRFSSLFFGMLSIALLYRLGASLLGPAGGLSAAALLAVSRFHVWWSQEIKMYALAIFLSLLALWFFVGLVRRPSRTAWIGHVVAMTLALYTLYVAAFLLLAEGLVASAALLVWRRGWTARGRLALLSTLAAPALLMIPWLLWFLGSGLAREGEGPMERSLFIDITTTVLPLGVSTDFHNLLPLAKLLWLAGLAGAFFWLWRGGTGPRLAAGLALAGLLVPAPLLYLLSQVPEGLYQPKFQARYLVLFTPLMALLLALGPAGLAHSTLVRWGTSPNPPLPRRGTAGKIAAGALALALLGATGVTLGAYYDGRARTWDRAALGAWISATARPEDALVMNPGHDWPVYAYHIRVPLKWENMPRDRRATRDLVQFLMAPAIHERSTIWVISAPEAASSDPDDELRRWLSLTYTQVDSRNYGRDRVTLFSRDKARDFTAAARFVPRLGSAAAAQDGLRFLGAEPLPRRVEPGQQLLLTTYWEGGTASPALWRAELRGTDGRQAGRPLGNGQARQAGGDASPVSIRQERLPIGSLLPSGTYELVLRPPDDTGTPLPLTRVEVAGAVVPPPPQPAHRVAAVFGGLARLAGYDIQPERPQPGQPLELRLYWEALDTTDTNYTVFVHLLDGAGRRLDQRDRAPGDGRRPTDTWSPGEVIVDSYTFSLDWDRLQGPLHFDVGLYDPTVNHRLPVLDRAGQPTDASNVSLAGPW